MAPHAPATPALRRYFVREQQETQVSQVELFLNSVPILASLSRDERLRLVDALEEVLFQQGSKVGGWGRVCSTPGPGGNAARSSVQEAASKPSLRLCGPVGITVLSPCSVSPAFLPS
jgi:hypothetical protein